MMEFWAIGDVHGNVDGYEGQLRQIHLTNPDVLTFMVGDMGVGFKGVRCPIVGPNDFWIAGNHDDALVCESCNRTQEHKGYLADFGVREFQGKKVFWLGGAESTDREYRVEGETWWAYEELTYAQLTEAVKLYEAEKPDIVITHDCPMQVRERWFYPRMSGRTVQALTQMCEIHKPQVWCFGHHHRQMDDIVEGVHFYCIGDQQNKKVKVEK